MEDINLDCWKKRWTVRIVGQTRKKIFNNFIL